MDLQEVGIIIPSMRRMSHENFKLIKCSLEESSARNSINCHFAFTKRDDTRFNVGLRCDAFIQVSTLHDLEASTFYAIARYVLPKIIQSLFVENRMRDIPVLNFLFLRLNPGVILHSETVLGNLQIHRETTANSGKSEFQVFVYKTTV